MLKVHETTEIVALCTSHAPNERPSHGIQIGMLDSLEAIAIARLGIPINKSFSPHEDFPNASAHLFVVVDGVVEIVAPGKGPVRYCLARLETGDLEDLYFFQDVKGLEVRAIRAAALLVFDRNVFYQTTCKDPDAARWVMQWSGLGQTRAQLHAYRLATMSAEEAVMYDLRLIAVRSETPPHAGHLVARTTQNAIAERIMRRRETVARAVTKLIAAGRLIHPRGTTYRFTATS